MNTAEIIEQLESEGVSLVLTPSGGLDVSGDREVIGRVLPLLRNNKPEIMDHLNKMKLGMQKADSDQSKTVADTPQSILSRTWTPGNPFRCKCGTATGWKYGTTPVCPACGHDTTVPDAYRQRMLAHADDFERRAMSSDTSEKQQMRLAVAKAIRESMNVK